jgi:gamma-glutamyltranspeptidase / glutathione hydrolase
MTNNPGTICDRTPHPTTVESERGVLLMTSGAVAVPRLTQFSKHGANAMDLALATAITQVVLSGGAWASFAGILSVVYYDAGTGEIATLDAGFDLPRRETAPQSIPRTGIASGRATLVPGFVAGVAAAHLRFGSVPWARLFGPAIEFAEEGFVVDQTLDALIAFRAGTLVRSPGALAALANPDGRLPARSGVIRQLALAATLRALAAQGSGYMYEGAWGQHLVAAVQQAGGRLCMEDLAAYSACWRDPLRTVYHGVDIVTIGLPQHGGLCLIEALNVIDAAALSRRGHYTRSSEALLGLIRTSHLCYAGYLDRSTPPSRRADPEWGRALWLAIERHGGLRLVDRLAGGGPAEPRRTHSDAVIAVDGNGNIAVLAHSINTTAWGTTALFVDGVSIPDAGAFQQSLLSLIRPGTRVPNALNPTLLLRSDRPTAAMAAIGGSVSEVMLQATINVIDFAMTPAETAQAPMVLQSVWPSLGRLQLIFVGVGFVVFGAAIISALLLMAGSTRWQPLIPLISVVLGAAINLTFVAAVLMADRLGWKFVPNLFDAPRLAVASGLITLAVVSLAWSLDWLPAVWCAIDLTFGVAATVFVPLLRGSLYPVTLVEPGDFDEALLKEMRRQGQPIQLIKRDPPRGYWLGAAWDAGARRCYGAVSPRTWDGIAVAL